MLDKIRGFFMGILNLFKTQSVEEVTGVETGISREMYERIMLWDGMLHGTASWNKDAPSCGILQQLTGKLDHMISREIGLTVKNPAIEKPLKHLDSQLGAIVEYITALGGALVRPIFQNNKLQFELLPMGNYIPTQYDFDGTLTGALILKNIRSKGKDFLLTEQHDYKDGNHYVKNTLYKNINGYLYKTTLGACEQTADITPEYVWENVQQPMIVEFRNNAINDIDGSQVPVALIAGAESIIKQADEQWARMNWEQEGGQLRVFADNSMFRKCQGPDDKPVGPKMTPTLNKLVVKINGDGIGSTNNNKITTFSPQLRTDMQNNFLQQIFRRIELTINFGKGAVSDLEGAQQTATQYNGGRQDLYAIVDYVEDEIAVKIQNCANVFAYMAAAYGLGSNDSTITVEWNEDKTRKDITAAKQQALQEVAQGVMDKWEYRVKFYGEDEATAKARVPVMDIAPDLFGGEGLGD